MQLAKMNTQSEFELRLPQKNVSKILLKYLLVQAVQAMTPEDSAVQ